VAFASLLAAVAVGALLNWPEAAKAQETAEKVVIPFDFESKFDNGRYGRMVGEMTWKKLERQGGFIIPETILDVRDWCQLNNFHPGPDTPLERMKQVVRDGFGADIAIWGKVERVAGYDWDVYDLWIFVCDFSTDPPKMIYKVKARTKTVSEIPHKYMKAALDKLYGRQPAAEAGPDPEEEKRWKEGPNLVIGDFEKGLKHPVGWDPLPPYVTWERPTADSHGRFIRFSFPKSVAASTGVLYYSDFFKIEAGAKYRFQCRWRTTGSSVKVFIKCYDELPTRFAGYKISPRGKEKREVYRSQQNLKGPKNQWNVHTEDFTPRHTMYTPRWGRVMLYAYWPAGTVDWDDIVLKQISPPRSEMLPKVRRPSLGTKVTAEEFRRAREELKKREEQKRSPRH